MTKNGYPEKFFDKIVRSFLNKIFEKAPTELIAPKRVVIFSLPYTGLHSIQIRKQIIKLFSSAYPHIQLRCIFRPVQRLSSFFQFKDRIPLGLRSRVVYKFKCQCCDALYFGETIRHRSPFGTYGNFGLYWQTSLKTSFSNILSHHQSSGHPIDPDDFPILTSCSSTFELLLRESLLISKF